MTVEHCVFPPLFLVAGFRLLGELITISPAVSTALRQLPAIEHSALVTLWYAVMTIILMVFDFLVAAVLILSWKSTRVKPDNWKEVVIPALATFWYATFNFFDQIPASVNVLLYPQSTINLLTPLAAVIGLTGNVIAVSAVINLNKSFGIFIRVQDIVQKGMYRYVRHPIYFAYLLQFIGLMLFQPRIFHVLGYLGAIAITVYRAVLEERKLSAHSEEYRRYQERVPFLFPRVFNLIKAPQSPANE